MRVPRKILPFACLLLAGAAAGYFFLVRVLRPVQPAIACPPAELHHWRCASYEIMVSKPFFVVLGALAGTWLAHALARRNAAALWRGFTIREGLVVAPAVLGITAWIIAVYPDTVWPWGSLRWVLVFLLAAVLARLAIGVAPIAAVRGDLILAFAMPAVIAGFGYAFIRIFQQPPAGHSCPSLAPASACVYHPLLGDGGPWIILGALAGLWLAYGIAADAARSPRRGQVWIEGALVLPVMTGVIFWALIVGPQQAGGSYVGLFVLAVGVTALLRLLLAARPVRRHVPVLLAKLGMLSRTRAAV